MNRKEIILAAMAGTGAASFSPVQMQKLLFLIEKNVGDQIGKGFDFVPYDYGPFDVDVYRELETLETLGDVAISRNGRWRSYSLTDSGIAKGTTLLGSLAPPLAHYIKQLAVWVRSLSFSQLVTAVYQMYPEMKVNSVFK